MILVRAAASAAAFVALGTVLAAPATAKVAEAAPAPAPLNWDVACPPDVIPGLAPMQCDRLAVPMNYQDPNGTQIMVSVSRIAATAPRKGVLLLNTGGPGGPGLNAPQVLKYLWSAESPALGAALDQYDLIGFDPRGVGTSTPVTCELTPAQATQSLVPLLQNGDFNFTVSYMNRVAANCLASNQFQGAGGHMFTGREYMPFVTTENTARDMDQIRRALGEAKISYFAYSYGTYLGAKYASTFPGNVDQFVLDSNVGPDLVWKDQFRSWALAGDGSLPAPVANATNYHPPFVDLAAWMAAHDAQYHFGTTVAAVRATYFTLVAHADQHSLDLGGGTYVNGPFFRELTLSGLYSPANFQTTADTWAAVRDYNGPPAPPSTLPAPVTPQPVGVPPSNAIPPTTDDNLAASGLAVVCDDVAWPKAASQYQAERNTDKTLFPVFGGEFTSYWACGSSGWPAPIEPLAPVTGAAATHIYLVQNERDPATPLPGAVDAKARLGNPPMLLADATGHAVTGLEGNQCVDNAVAAYFTTGSTATLFCPAQPAAPAIAAPAEPNNPTHERAWNYLQQLIRGPVHGSHNN